jgi:uncharacterized membrane protein
MVKQNNTENKLTIDEKVTNIMGSIGSIIVHTFLFLFFLLLPVFTSIPTEKALLILTTIVSLEAIYLALFIQISINRQSQIIDEVSESMDEISEDVEEIQRDVDEIQEDVEEIQEDVEEVSKDVEEISEDVEDIQEDIETPEEEKEEELRKEVQQKRLEKIENTLEILLKEIHNLNSQKK